MLPLPGKTGVLQLVERQPAIGFHAVVFRLDQAVAIAHAELLLGFENSRNGNRTASAAVGRGPGLRLGGHRIGVPPHGIEPHDSPFGRACVGIRHLDPDTVGQHARHQVVDVDINAWLSKLDRTYEAYRDLVGDVPFDGRKIMILNTPGIEPGYWALAGNPILWNSHVAVSKLLDRTVEFGDWGFGIIHEIGHVFSQGNISGTGRWNWNDEIFANFRMSYALEACDGTMSQRDICYRGADVINYYKIFYDETIGAGIPKNNGDALHYTFLRIKERYGWDVYKKAFRELYALGDSGQEGLETPYDKFLFFLSYVSKAAGEDVVAATYTPGELALIEESLRN